MARALSAGIQRHNSVDQPRSISAGSALDANLMASQCQTRQLQGKLFRVRAAARADRALAAARLRAAAGGYRQAAGIHPPFPGRATKQRISGTKYAASAAAQERSDGRGGQQS